MSNNSTSKREIGNAAAMRLALADFVVAYEEDSDIDIEMMSKAYEKAKSALAAPPRNCDVGSAEEQSKRFMDFCCPGFRPPNCEKCKVYPNRMNKFWCQLEWAQMPYEEGGKE